MPDSFSVIPSVIGSCFALSKYSDSYQELTTSSNTAVERLGMCKRCYEQVAFFQAVTNKSVSHRVLKAYNFSW